MALTLKIISPANMPPGQLPEFTFDELGGTIGRKPNNDFILIDPERFISSQHATIEYQNGKYFISDTSTNGVFINNSKRPVGTGNSEELHNGDKVAIGEFQLLVMLSEASTPEASWDHPAPAAEPAADLFDFNEPLFQQGSEAGSREPMDPLALLGGDYSDTADKFQSQPNIPPASPDSAHDDFFENILENPHQNIPSPLPINEPFTPPSAIPDDWDIMGDDEASHKQAGRGESTGFHRQPSQPVPPAQPIQPVQPIQREQPDSLFPDTEFESTTPLIPEDASLFDEDDIFASLAASAQPAPPLQTAPPQTTAPKMPPQYSPPAQPPTAPTPAAHPSMAQPQQPGISTNRELLDAFIRGAGLDPSQVKTDNPVELLVKLGQLTRISTEGLMMALRARATIKSSFRVNKTIIAPIENNPLKFSVTSEDALNIIFADEKAGYMSATEAFSEGFKDLQTHQMAMMAGMQAIIKAITEQFSPERLERKFEQQKTGTSFIPGNKKAKNWEMYETFYKKMTETLQDDFQNVYGEEFARAYENQIRKLM